jgi:hypothetical protein
MTNQDKIQFRRVGEEWTAVYLNGVLQHVGDSYHADEWLAAHCGVEIIDDTHSDCMIDPWTAYRDLDIVERITAAREDRERRAAELIAQADALKAEAAAITGGTA